MSVTLSDVQTALLDNADFEEDGSLAKAKAFQTAAKQWFILVPNSTSKEGASMSMHSQQIENLLKRANAYIAANDTANNNRRQPGVRFIEVTSRW